MRKSLLFPTALAAALFLTGCFETKQEFTLNPDGSGKVKFDSLYLPLLYDREPAVELRETVKEIVEQSEGVSAWRDISCDWTDDGQIHFQGTAYFSDLSKLRVQQLAMMEFTFKADGKNRRVLESRYQQTGTIPRSTNDWSQLAPAEREKKARHASAKFRRWMPILRALLDMKQDAVFHLPGRVVEHSNFRVIQGDSLGIQYDGKKMVTALESRLNDADLVANLPSTLQPAPKPLILDPELNEVMFGTRGPVRAVVGGDMKPFFNYNDEVAAALADFARTQIDWKLKFSPAVPLAEGELSLGNVRIVGIKWLFERVDTSDWLMRKESPGYMLRVIGELPGRLVQVGGGVVETAVCASGADMLPPRIDERKIHSSLLISNDTAVFFEVPLSRPDPAGGGWKEIAGRLDCWRIDEAIPTDLGIPALRSGATGTVHQALLLSLESRAATEKGKLLRLRLDVPPKQLGTAHVAGASDRRVPLELRGHMEIGGSWVYSFTSEASLPSDGRLFVMIDRPQRKYEVRFAIKNVSFLGQPLP